MLSIPLVTDTGWSYGFAWGDYDRDGDLDIFQARTLNDDENNALYRNDEANGNHWLTFRLVGTASNRAAIGARVKVERYAVGPEAGGQRCAWWRDRAATAVKTWSCTSPKAATTASRVIVECQSGAIDVHPDMAADDRVLVEGTLPASVDPINLDQGSLQVIPHPFHDRAELTFSLERNAFVQLDVFDPLGRRVSRLVDEHLPAGRHIASFDAPENAPRASTSIDWSRMDRSPRDTWCVADSRPSRLRSSPPRPGSRPQARGRAWPARVARRSERSR
ncbi:MAG: VCBS repeat-containing protein [Candidatus Eisenbacteria bacterium]